jgi:TonB family protein
VARLRPQVLVDENGRVLGLRVVKDVEGAAFLTDAARKAVLKWRFEPARKDGVAVRVWRQVRVQFEAPS